MKRLQLLFGVFHKGFLQNLVVVRVLDVFVAEREVAQVGAVDAASEGVTGKVAAVEGGGVRLGLDARPGENELGSVARELKFCNQVIFRIDFSPLQVVALLVVEEAEEAEDVLHLGEGNGGFDLALVVVNTIDGRVYLEGALLRGLGGVVSAGGRSILFEVGKDVKLGLRVAIARDQNVEVVVVVSDKGLRIAHADRILRALQFWDAVGLEGQALRHVAALHLEVLGDQHLVLDEVFIDLFLEEGVRFVEDARVVVVHFGSGAAAARGLRNPSLLRVRGHARVHHHHLFDLSFGWLVMPKAVRAEVVGVDRILALAEIVDAFLRQVPAYAPLRPSAGVHRGRALSRHSDRVSLPS